MRSPLKSLWISEPVSLTKLVLMLAYGSGNVNAISTKEVRLDTVEKTEER